VPAQRPDAESDEEPDGSAPREPGAESGAQPAAEQGAEPEQGAKPEQDPDQPAAASGGLGARERAVLDFERRRWRNAGTKEQAVRDTFDLSATRYYQILNALLDEPEALAYAPALVGRLRRIRDARQQARH
jgi:hypothetical protein